MNQTGAMFVQRFHVLFGKVSFMHVETVLRILAMVFNHCTVPCNFSKYRGRTYCGDLVVTFYDRLCRDIKDWSMVPINQDPLGLDLQTLYSTFHGKEGSMKDIEPLDLFQARLLYTPAQCV